MGEEEATWSGGDDRWRRNLADSLVVNENDGEEKDRVVKALVSTDGMAGSR